MDVKWYKKGKIKHKMSLEYKQNGANDTKSYLTQRSANSPRLKKPFLPYGVGSLLIDVVFALFCNCLVLARFVKILLFTFAPSTCDCWSPDVFRMLQTFI